MKSVVVSSETDVQLLFQYHLKSFPSAADVTSRTADIQKQTRFAQNQEAMETQSILISLLVVLSVIAGAYWAYQEGYADPLIEQVGVYLFKAKAMAEKKKLQAQGMKAGEDFVDCKFHPSPPTPDRRDGGYPRG